MPTGQLHLTPDGPRPCGARTSESCKYGSTGHYDSMDAAEMAYEDQMGGALPLAQHSNPATIVLSSNLGEATVADGDLSDPKARVLLASGRCGDLALAIAQKTGGAAYCVSVFDVSEEKLQEEFEKNPDSISNYASHVVVESPSRKGHFLDSFGQQDREALEDGWEALSVVKMTPEMLQHFGNSGEAKKLENFAEAALALDRANVGYDYSDLDEYSDEDSDEWLEEEDYEELAEEDRLDWEAGHIELPLDFGSARVRSGDLSDAKTRFYFANGLCLDLAQEVARQSGGRIYFSVDSSVSEEQLDEAAARGEIQELMAHAVVESPRRPGLFLDAYGIQNRESIGAFFGAGAGAKLLEAKDSWIASFPSRGEVDLSSFSHSVLEMDRLGVSHDYSDFGH